MRILIVEDQPDTRRMVEDALRDASFTVDSAADVESALTCLGVSEYDAVILDWMLPDGSGIDLCRRMRQEGQEVPVLFLTAKGDVADRVAGLNAGGDDYLRKPFAVAELIARLRALTRRRSPGMAPVNRVGDAQVDLAARRVTLDEREVPLTAKEFALLECLLSRRGRAVARTDILRMVWDDPTLGAEASLEVLISRLRRKLSNSATPCPIRTHRGYGYSVPLEP
jgi:DNA-binding response OmpR family regulator